MQKFACMYLIDRFAQNDVRNDERLIPKRRQRHLNVFGDIRIVVEHHPRVRMREAAVRRSE